MKSVRTPSTVVVPAGRICPRCGAPLGGYGPEGMCGACLFDSGLAADEPAADLDLLATGSRRFGDYELLEEIARGGMGVVFKARQLSLNRIVAVKMILRGKFASVADLARFRAEAETAARLQHPNIVAIHEVGEHEGQPYFSMDYLAGQNLAQLVGNTPLPATRAATYLKIVAEAVQYAHQQGVLHRDLKPSNVLIDASDQPRVTDFGLAKRLSNPVGMRSAVSHSVGEKVGDAAERVPTRDLTITGQILGSPSFMPPEQAAGRNDAVGPASDVYSLGAILYHALTGRPPFVAENVPATLRLVAESEPVSPRLLIPTVPRDLETICLKCLQKEPPRRYAVAQELAEELGRFLRDEPIHARPVGQGERFWRWCWRNRALASTGAAVLALLLTVAIGSPIAILRINHERQQAEDNATKEEQQRMRAEANAGKAEQAAKLEAEQRARAEKLAEETRWNLYVARIRNVEQALKEGDTARAEQLLDSLRPLSGQDDLRSFDWFYLWQRCHSEIMSLPGTPGLGRTVAFSPDGRWLATIGDGGLIRLRNATNGVERASVTGHTGRVNEVAFAPHGGTLASAGEDGTVRIWDAASATWLKTLRIGTNSIAVLAFSSDGRFLAAGEGSRDPNGDNASLRYIPPARSGRVAIWNTTTYELERIMDAHASGVLGLAFAPDGRRLASCGVDRIVKLMDSFTGDTLAARTNPVATVFDLAFLPDGRELVVASWFPHGESGEITILNAATLETRRSLGASAGKVLCLTVSPDGSQLASAGADWIARLWDIASGTERADFYGHNRGITSLAFTPDGKALASAGRDAIKLWEVDNTPVRQRIATQNSFSVAFSPDGKLLACAGREVEIRDAGSGRLLRSLTEYTNADIRVAFAPDGSVLAATGFDGAVHFWDASTWKHWTPSAADSESSTIGGSRFEPDSHFAFSPDSKTLVMGGDDKVIRFWDPRTGALKHAMTGPDGYVTSVAFTADGVSLFTGGRVLGIWDAASKTLKTTIPTVAGAMLRTSPDGRWLVTGNMDLRELPTLKRRSTLVGHRDQIYCVVFSHDSRLAATASWDGTVKVWQTITGQELLTIPSQAGVIWSVAFAPGDRSLAFGCGANTPAGGEVVVLRAASESRTDSPRLLVRLALEQAQSHARQGQWREAAAAMTRAVELDPANHFHYHQLAPLLVASGDLAGYRKYRQQIVARFCDTKNPTTAERMAKACLILPDAEMDFAFIQQMVGVAMSADPNSSLFQYSQFGSGLAAYRQGDYASALEHLQPLLTKPPPDPNLGAAAWLVMAMARHGLNQPDEARAALAQGLEITRTRLPKLEDGDIGGSWNDWIIAHTLLREAQALIEGYVMPTAD